MAQLLLQKGIETFCPVLKAKSQWSDRVKIVEKPLFKSFVFVKAGEDQRTVVRLTEGVVNFVYRNGKPAVLKEKVIQSIRQFQQMHTVVEVREMQPAEEPNANGHLPCNDRNPLAILWIETLNLTLIAHPPQLFETTTDKL